MVSAAGDDMEHHNDISPLRAGAENDVGRPVTREGDDPNQESSRLGRPPSARSPIIPALQDDGDESSFSRQDTVVVDDPYSKVNPFYYDSKASSGALQIIKMFLVGITLFPIRIITFIFALLMAWVLCKLMTIGVSDEALLQKPLHRPVLRFLFRKCARIAMWSLGFWWISRNGTEHVDMKWEDAMQRCYKGGRPQEERGPGDGPHTTAAPSSYRAPILVANHSTLLDTMYLASYHDFMAVGKAELLDLPLLGAYCRALQYIPVRRESANSRKEVAREIGRRSASAEDCWQTLVIFPEATCTNGRSIIQFKLGAFVPAAPVQPMTLRYPYKHLMLDWVGTSTLHGLIIRAMLQVYNSMTVEYLPIHFPNAEERADITVYAQNVRESLANALGVPMTDHTFEDVQLLNEAHALHVPFSDDINVAMGLPQHRSMGIERAKAKLKEFATFDTNGDGRLNREEFGRMLGLTGEEVNPLGNNEGLKAKMHIRDAIFDRWLNDGKGKKKRGKGGYGIDSGEEDTIDFGTFLACTAANKIRLRMRDRRSASVLAGGHTQPLSCGGDTSVIGSQKSFFLDEAQDEEVLYCVALCFGSFDLDHDGAISREEFHRGMALVCPTLTGDTTESYVRDAAPGAWGAPREQAEAHNTTADVAHPSVVLDQMFDEVDTNRDGQLQLEEFMLFAKSHPVFLHHLLNTFEAHNMLAF